MMKRGKDRAEVRTGDLKQLLMELENHRDRLLDEMAKKKGEVEATEKIIKRTYEIILDVNKDERDQENLEKTKKIKKKSRSK